MIIKNRSDLLSKGYAQGRAVVLEILEAGLRAIEPYARTQRLIRREGNTLRVGGCPDADLSGFGDETIDLDRVDNVYVIGAGKTVQRQAQALEDLLGDRLTSGALTIKRGETVALKRITVTEGAHPVPDEYSLLGTRRILAIVDRATSRDLIFTLFSSGASSLCVLPPEPHSLDDVRTVYRLAIKYGDMSIIWRVMRYFSLVNSGRVLLRAPAARTVNLLMSFKPYLPWGGRIPETPSWITPWPPGPRRLPEAVQEFRAATWWDELPHRMRSAFERLDPGCEVPDLDEFRKLRCSFWQPIDYRLLLDAAAHAAEGLGVRAAILGNWWAVQSTDAAEIMVGLARECATRGAPFVPPVALISGGELTVPVGNATGVGGRNQEFVLAAAQRIAEQPRAGMVVGSIDSDGTDGPGIQLTAGAEPAACLAGGLADETTCGAAVAAKIDLKVELERHNSTPTLRALGGGIFTGNTGICAGDLRVVLVQRTL
jgi:hydroxypyruvate reductase